MNNLNFKTIIPEGKRFVKTWLCDSSGGYTKGVILGCVRVFFAVSSLILLTSSFSSFFNGKSIWEESKTDPWISSIWYESMAHVLLISGWVYYKEQNKKSKGGIWIVALLIFGSGVTFLFVTKELSVITAEEEFITILFRRTDVVRRYDSVLEFNEKHPMQTSSKNKTSNNKNNLSSNKDNKDEIDAQDLLDF